MFIIYVLKVILYVLSGCKHYNHIKSLFTETAPSGAKKSYILFCCVSYNGLNEIPAMIYIFI